MVNLLVLRHFLAARARLFLSHKGTIISFCRLVLRLFVVIGIVNSFHEQFAVIDLVSQGIAEQTTDVAVIYRALAHCSQILVLIYLTPIDTFLERTLENQIQLDACTASVTFHERMCYVHLHILTDNLVKCCFRHGFDSR